MHDRWLDTAITPLEVISVSTPQNNDDACPVSLIYIEVQYQLQYVQKKAIPSKCLNGSEENHTEAGRHQVSGHTYIYIGKRGKRKMLSIVPTSIQFACKCLCPTHIHFKKLFLSFLFNTFSTVRLSSF